MRKLQVAAVGLIALLLAAGFAGGDAGYWRRYVNLSASGWF